MSECECVTWACEDVNLVNDSPHHPRCPKYREIVYWDKDGEERLSYEDKDEAIERILEDMIGMDDFEICGYARMKKPDVTLFAASLLEDSIESLDSNYKLGSPDDPTDSTDNMKAAALIFATVLLEEYEPWACEVVVRQTIDVASWIKDNRPDWLEE